jgi:hypothetical protein
VITIALATLALQLAALSGELPSAIDAASVAQITWVAADAAAARQRDDCYIRGARTWICPRVSGTEAGVVVFQTGAAIGFVLIGERGAIASGVSTSGRLVRVVAPQDAPIVTAVALTVDRPSVRPKTRLLDVVAATQSQVWPMTRTVFWVAAVDPTPDAFVRFTAEGAAPHDEPFDRLMADVPQVPLTISLQLPVSLGGRVESAAGDGVDGAVVDLFALRPGSPEQLTPEELNTAELVRVGETRSDGAGQFTFAGLEARSYKVAATHFSRGRGEQWSDSAASPVLVRLHSPSQLTGRVLRDLLPARDVVVRFRPDALAWRASTDPAAHLTLDASTDDAGRFVLVLPPSADGSVQFTATDGASTRIRLPAASAKGDIALGDVVLQSPIAVEVQTDAADCTLAAVGPAGVAGFAIVRAQDAGVVHALQLPEPGLWLIQAECGGVQRRVSPSAVDVSAKGELSTTSVHVSR